MSEHELRGCHLVGTRLSREGTEEFFGVDPRTGESLSPGYLEATDGEIDQALELAGQARTVLAHLERSRRAAFLERIAGEIEGLGETLIERASAETGLPPARLTMERGRTTSQLRMFAGVVRRGAYLEACLESAEPERKPVPRPDLRRMQIPLGPVIVFGASNFPLAFSVAGGDTASALAAGCPVVVKAHPHHPGTSELVGRAVLAAVRACDLPDGSFSLLHGASPRVGLALVRHSLAQAVGFTGSFAGGKAIFDAAAARPEPIPVHAEMGSSNPVFLLPGALAERGETIAEDLCRSLNLGVGQFCTKPGLVVALEDEASAELVRRLGALVEQCPEGTMLHAGIAKAFDDGLVRWARLPGVERVAGGGEVSGPSGARAALLRTDASTLLAHAELGHELFGPCALAVLCRSAEELYAVARRLHGQLTATVHGTQADLESFEGLAEILVQKVGRLVFDGYPTGVEFCAAMQHGGPFPATTDARMTSVGPAAIGRFLRPVCFSDAPSSVLPPELRDGNPCGIPRRLDGEWEEG